MKDADQAIGQARSAWWCSCPTDSGALVSVVTEAYLAGVSTRRVEGLVQSLGIEGISESRVSELAKSPDEPVEDFRNRPLDTGPYTYLWLDPVSPGTDTRTARGAGRLARKSRSVRPDRGQPLATVATENQSRTHARSRSPAGRRHQGLRSPSRGRHRRPLGASGRAHDRDSLVRNGQFDRAAANLDVVAVGRIAVIG